MAKVVFENLTMAQAEELASWFDGQGEQDCTVWFESSGIPSPWTDKINVDKENETVTVTCK